MLTKNDLLILLTDLENTGEAVDEQTMSLLKSPTISFDVLKFINDKRQLDVASFYTLIRKNYNNKKSSLYKNIVKENSEELEEVLVILSSLNLQIMLFAEKLEDNRMFLKHSRGEEITQVLNNYYKNYDLRPCIKLLRLIKADLMVFDYITGRRDLDGHLLK